MSLQVPLIELGHATDTTLSRVSAGLIAVEGVTIVDVSTAQTLTNKTLTTTMIIKTKDTTAGRIAMTMSAVTVTGSCCIFCDAGGSMAWARAGGRRCRESAN